MKHQPFTRREFLKSAAVGGAALALPTIVPSTALGRNAPGNRITVGLIGMGLMMRGHQNIMLGREGVQVLAVCDVDPPNLKKGVEAAGSQPQAFSDHTELLGRKRRCAEGGRRLPGYAGQGREALVTQPWRDRP